MLEQVARAIAIGACNRKWPNADPAFIARRVDATWEEYQPDARLVIHVINGLVEAEQFADATDNVPATPAFLSTVQ